MFSNQFQDNVSRSLSGKSLNFKGTVFVHPTHMERVENPDSLSYRTTFVITKVTFFATAISEFDQKPLNTHFHLFISVFLSLTIQFKIANNFSIEAMVYSSGSIITVSSFILKNCQELPLVTMPYRVRVTFYREKLE
jgi:hypothetical protein